MNSLIEPSKTLGYSNIYLDFLQRKESVKPFYPTDSVEWAASRLDSINYNRDTISGILKKQNIIFGAGEKTFENIELFKNSQKSLCLFAGQQAGLFGGALLIIIKALALVKAAKKYTDQLKRPVIPVFWIAGDDHDFKEVNHTFVLNRNSDPIKVCYNTLPEKELPASEIIFSDKEELEKAKELLKNTLGETDFTAELYQMIDDTYSSSETFASAFGKLMAKLTYHTGLVYFSPGDNDVKNLSIPFFKNVITKQNDLHRLLNDTNEKIKKTGYHLQVEKKEHSTHLFYNNNGRKSIMRNGDGFLVVDKYFSKDELIEEIEHHPERFSPDVMTRPILQSYLFPVLSQKGGAAEIAYMAQLNKFFNLFDLIPPFYMGRPTLTVVENRFAKIIDEYHIEFEEVTGDIELVINRILAESFPDDIEIKFHKLRSDIRERYEEFSSDTLKFDNTLESYSNQIYGKIDFNLKAFEAKVFASHKKKSKDTRDKIYRLWHTIYPNRNFQERSINIFYFLSRYGINFINFLYEQIDCEQQAHQLLDLTEYKT